MRGNELFNGQIINRTDAVELQARLDFFSKKIMQAVNSCLEDGREIDVAQIRRQVYFNIIDVMNKRNELFKKALDWLYSEGKVADQRELSLKTEINEVTISRILNDKVKEPSESTLRKFNAAFNHIFNMDYFRGKDVPMLVDSGQLSTNNNTHNIDVSSAINAAISAYVQLIETKDDVIAEKDARIVALEQIIIDKEKIIKEKDARIAYIERQLTAIQLNEIDKYPFSIGAADGRENPKIQPNVSPPKNNKSTNPR